MNDISPGPGHNQPPTLAEELASETATDLKRMAQLVSAANQASITDAETQKQVAALAGLIRTHQSEVETKRKARKTPFDQGALAVQRAFKPILDPLDEALGMLRRMNDRYEAELEKEREDERKRLAEEEEAQRRAAEEAAARAASSSAEGGESLADELAAAQAQEAAELAKREREAIRATPVRTDVGSATVATRREYVIENLKGCLTFLQRAQKEALLAAIQPIVDRLGRARVAIPGVRVVESKSTRFGR